MPAGKAELEISLTGIPAGLYFVCYQQTTTPITVL